SAPCTSTPVGTPSRSNVATSTSVGELPAPAWLRRPPEPLLVRLAAHRVDRTLSARRARRRAA
ncbi:hypothetical protein AB0C69_31905, partial [Actinomadura sp. NPDC048032]|uniref:hypothetical protein n=1 Tax=Actinomadura sp. NPDC048032 TaxID=3155747 RepID=UPI0033D1154B